jgi:hypothetical protein
MSTDQLSMSMFATRADYDEAVRAQYEQLTGLQIAVKLLAQIGNDDSDRAIAAVHDLAEAHAQRLTLQHHAADQVWRIADLEVKCVTLKDLHDAAADERDELRARLAELEGQEPICMVQMTTTGGRLRYNPDATQLPEHGTPLYARPVPAQAVPESVEGLVSVFCYDEVLTFTFCDEASADKFAGRFDPSVDTAAAPEHKA